MSNLEDRYEESLRTAARQQSRRRRRRREIMRAVAAWIGVAVAVCLAITLLWFALDADAAEAQGSPGEAQECIAAIISAQAEIINGVLVFRPPTPEEALVVLAACDQGALEALGQRPVGCHRDRPNDVTCGYPRRSARRHPDEYERYVRVRSRLIRCRYQEIADIHLRQCARLYRQFRARWVEGTRDPDLPEQVRFTLQIWDWVR